MNTGSGVAAQNSVAVKVSYLYRATTPADELNCESWPVTIDIGNCLSHSRTVCVFRARPDPTRAEAPAPAEPCNPTSQYVMCFRYPTEVQIPPPEPPPLSPRTHRRTATYLRPDRENSRPNHRGSRT